MEILRYFIVGIGLSMDAFSLSILYGIFLEKRQLLLSSMVGIFHFFMPLLGSMIGSFYIAKYLSHPNYLVGFIFLLLSLEMLWSIKKDEKLSLDSSIIHILGFAFTVSLDSFSIGIGFGANHENIILSGLIFTFCSFIFTYIGLTFGKRLQKSFGKKANLFGCILLFLLSIFYFFG